MKTRKVKVKDLKFLPKSKEIRKWGINGVEKIRYCYRNGDDLGYPIVDENTLIIVDGMARVLSFKKVFGEDALMKVEIRKFPTKMDIFEKFVEINHSQGEGFDGYQVNKIIEELNNAHTDTAKIARLLKIEESRIRVLLDDFVVVRIGGPSLAKKAKKKNVYIDKGRVLTKTEWEVFERQTGVSLINISNQLVDRVENEMVRKDEANLNALKRVLDTLLEFFKKNPLN